MLSIMSSVGPFFASLSQQGEQGQGVQGYAGASGASVETAEAAPENYANNQPSNSSNALQETPATNLRDLPGAHLSCTYTQSTGNLTCHDTQGNEIVNHNGYSGRNVSGGVQGRNNPDAQNVRNIGPIPQGSYTLEADRPNDGRPIAFPLTPDSDNNMYGRSGFMIHGDNAQNDASQGCIIMLRDVRELLHEGDRLEVIR